MRFVLWLLLSLSLSHFALAFDSKDLLVEYTFQGKKHSIQGKEAKEHTYVYNSGAKNQIKISTLDWAPYIGEKICKQGWVQQYTIALLTSLDYEVTASFYPWARSVSLVESGEASILYPEYFIELAAPSEVEKEKKRRDLLVISERFPGGPIAFMKRKGETTKFAGDFEALKGEKIGVVRGYQNTPDLDALIDKKFFSDDKAKDDEQNAKKLDSKRVNLIVGDPSVIRYSVANSSDPEAKKALDILETVQPALKYNYLYLAISKKVAGWDQLQDAINLRIGEFESTGTMFKIIEETNKACGFKMDTLLPYQKL